jgi:acyl carrier protein
MQYVRIIAKLEEELDIELPISIMEVSKFNEFLNIVKAELDNID